MIKDTIAVKFGTKLYHALFLPTKVEAYKLYMNKISERSN